MLADGGFAKRPAESFDLRAPELQEGFSVALGIALEALQTFIAVAKLRHGERYT